MEAWKIEFCQKWEEIIKMVKHFNITFGNERYYLKGAFTEEREQQREKWFSEELNELIDACDKNNRVEILDAICDMYYIHIGTLLEKHEGDIQKVLNEFFLVESESENRDRNLLLIKMMLPNLKKWDVYFYYDDILIKAMEEVHRSNMSKLDDNGRPIYREDGKIMKSKNFFAPNLKQFIMGEY